MTASIFIKTYSEDLKWLKYALQSIWKFASGFSEVVIVADTSCFSDLQNMETGLAKLYSIRDWENGYIQQQSVKLRAYEWTFADNILFVDSDCVFHTPFSPESFMRDNKPILMKTRYGDLGGAEAWKLITGSVVGWDVEFEYMRRLPWMYRSETLIAFHNTYPELQQKLRAMTTRDFSEFNALGAFIDRFESHLYFVSDTEDWIPESVAKQFWSWGGISEDITAEIKGILG